MTKKLSEDAPTNNIGSGAIAGAGVTSPDKPDNWGEPGISKKVQKKRTVMLRRKKPVMEVNLINLPKKTKLNYMTGKKMPLYAERIGRVNKTHDLHYDELNHSYHAVNKKTGKADISVAGTRTRTKHGYVFQTDSLDSTRNKDKPKAHDFYHSILKSGHSHILKSSDVQSPGGFKTWQRLARKKSVNVHDWSHKKGSENLNPYHDEDDLTVRGREERDQKTAETKAIAKKVMVAHLKEESKVKMGKFAGTDTFIVPPDHYHKARTEKAKGKHWRTYIGEDDYGTAIREYANKNPDKGIILQCERTGAMCYARYGKK